MIELLRRPLIAAEKIAKEPGSQAAGEESEDGDHGHLADTRTEAGVRIPPLIVVEHGCKGGEKDAEEHKVRDVIFEREELHSRKRPRAAAAVKSGPARGPPHDCA